MPHPTAKENVERIRTIVALARRHGAVSMHQLQNELEAHVSTIKRDIDVLRDRLGCPLEYDRTRRVYMIRNDLLAGGGPYELPGLWFNSSELYALLTMLQLLRGVQPGLLDRTLHPLKARLTKLLGTGGTTTRELERRVKVIHFASRRIEAKHFELLTGAVLERRRLRLTYRNRDRRDVTVREVSPQQLVHYRENWLLDAWCHSRDAIRSFALDAIEQVVLLDAPAEEVPPEVLDAHFRSGYGIYAGVADQVARLKFTPGQAQYVSLESWHHDQRSQWLPDGSYLLEVPYSSDAELVMDLMRHGAEVEVLGPPALRVKVAASLAAAASRYR